MFKETLDGLDKVFKTDIKGPKIILVTGPPGSLKSSFIYTLMVKHLDNTGEFGLYTTLEETAESHLNNMDSLGIESSLNLQISVQISRRCFPAITFAARSMWSASMTMKSREGAL